MHAPRRSQQALLTGLWWTALVLAGAAFLLRDLPGYASYTPTAYGEYWVKRASLIPHILAAAPAFLVGFLQFSGRLRARRPRLHRMMGLIYVAGTFVGAPAAILLGVQSTCVLCRPPLVLLGVFWFATTAMAFLAARGRDFATHRAFMIRSFALMNVFSLIRLADDIAIPGLSPDQQQVLWEWSCMAIIVVGTEVGLTWWPALRRLRQPGRDTPRSATA